MTTFTYTTTDAAHLAAIAAARSVFNANNPQAVQPDDESFFTFMVEARFRQWVSDHQQALLTQAITAAQAGDPTQLVAVAQVIAASAQPAS